MNRTKLATLNSGTVLITQLVTLILKFAVQTVFIHQLSQSFLGLNSLFANVISFLSFADLGIGTAITVALYQPIANNDLPALRGLLVMYRKVYLIIGSLITVIGCLLAPLVHFFIKGSAFSNGQISGWFVLYLIGTTATYFAAYKRSYLMATQEGYLNSLNDFCFRALQFGTQIIVILVWQSYLFFLIIQLVCVALSNWQLSRMARRRHPEVFQTEQVSIQKPTHETVSQIKRNVVGSMSSNISSIVVMGTDNLILSALVGLAYVAKYANYMLLIQSVNSLFSQALKAVVASIGNLNVTSESDKKEDILFKLLYLNSVINIVLVLGLAVGINFFINIWAGAKYLLTPQVVMIILANFLVNQARYPIQNFISGMGLYWSLRWKSLVEAGVNLVISLILVLGLNWGIYGVVCGNLISNIAINTWWEPLIVYRHGLHRSLKPYLIRYCRYFLISLLALLSGLGLASLIGPHAWKEFIFYEIFAEILGLLVFFWLTRKTPEFHFYRTMIQKLGHRLLHH